MIEGANIDVDGGYGESPPYQTKAFLQLTGDFTEECERYLNDEKETNISFEIGRDVAERLYKELGQVLYGGF